jgi:hypothetical protein
VSRIRPSRSRRPRRRRRRRRRHTRRHPFRVWIHLVSVRQIPLLHSHRRRRVCYLVLLAHHVSSRLVLIHCPLVVLVPIHVPLSL